MLGLLLRVVRMRHAFQDHARVTDGDMQIAYPAFQLALDFCFHEWASPQSAPEYQDRELMVFYQAGIVDLGAARIANSLRRAVINELVKRAGLPRKSKSKM